MVLLMIQGKCAGFRAKNVQVSGHLPTDGEIKRDGIDERTETSV